MATHEQDLTDILLNGASFIGLLLLSVPVIVLDRHKQKLQRLKDSAPDRGGKTPPSNTQSAPEAEATPGGRTRARNLTHPAAVEKREHEVSAWKLWHRLCLWVGYLCLLGASFVRFVVSLLS
jgi:hypothetical protein